MFARRTAMTLAAAVASLALAASPALARGGSGSGGGGGGGGGTTTTVDTAPTFDAWSLCPEYVDPIVIKLADGSDTFANTVVNTACVIVRESGGVLSLYSLRLAPGWVADVKSAGGGNSNTVDIEFTYPPTGEKHSFMTKPGKLVIR